jgi:hypothetical protein
MPGIASAYALTTDVALLYQKSPVIPEQSPVGTVPLTKINMMSWNLAF